MVREVVPKASETSVTVIWWRQRLPGSFAVRFLDFFVSFFFPVHKCCVGRYMRLFKILFLIHFDRPFQHWCFLLDTLVTMQVDNCWFSYFIILSTFTIWHLSVKKKPLCSLLGNSLVRIGIVDIDMCLTHTDHWLRGSSASQRMVVRHHRNLLWCWRGPRFGQREPFELAFVSFWTACLRYNRTLPRECAAPILVGIFSRTCACIISQANASERNDRIISRVRGRLSRRRPSCCVVSSPSVGFPFAHGAASSALAKVSLVNFPPSNVCSVAHYGI